MTSTELIQAIKAEIERLVDEYKPIVGGVDELTGAHIVLANLFSFLSTLEQEKPNDLEEAAKAYALDTAEDSEQYSARYLGYKDGAKWQKQHDDKELSEKIAAAYQLGLVDKEKQMMEDAVEVCTVVEEGRYCQEIGPLFLDERAGFKPGDKVRVIIVKE